MQRQIREPVMPESGEIPVGRAPTPFESSEPADPILSDAEVESLLVKGTDTQSKDFSRYAVLEAVKDCGLPPPHSAKAD